MLLGFAKLHPMQQEDLEEQMDNPYEPPKTKPNPKVRKKDDLSPLEIAFILLIGMATIGTLAWNTWYT